MKLVIAVAIAIGSVVVSCTASAHEFWIRPERFAVDPGERVGVALMVGTGWPGEGFPRQSQRIVRFSLVDAAGERPIEGDDGTEPAGRVVAGAAGTAWLQYRSNDATVKLGAATFAKYLEEEGLDTIARLRVRRGTASLETREHYSRCAKALLSIGGGGGGVPDTPLGLALELLPLGDPRRVGEHGRLDVRLVFHGRPLPGALVKAMRQSEPGHWHTTRTDADGRAVVELPKGAAVWLVSAVHMTAAPPRSGVDWQSIWSSLTFEARAAP